MNIKFIECDFSLTKQTLESLAKKEETNYLLLLIEKTEKERDYHYQLKEKKTQKIVIVEYHPNIIILGHDLFYEDRCDKERIIGYYPLVFEEKYRNIIRI